MTDFCKRTEKAATSLLELVREAARDPDLRAMTVGEFVDELR